MDDNIWFYDPYTEDISPSTYTEDEIQTVAGLGNEGLIYFFFFNPALIDTSNYEIWYYDPHTKDIFQSKMWGEAVVTGYVNLENPMALIYFFARLEAA